MKIGTIVCGYLEENCYILSNEMGDGIIIDPGDRASDIIKYVNKNELNIRAILITHYHFDHVGALDKIKEEYDVKVYDYKKPGVKKVHGGFNFEVVLTPGHTSDSCSFYFEKDHILFTGDFLFKESIGRYDFETSSFIDMQKSISWVKTLPSGIDIYPGHGDNTTLSYEIKHNMYLK